MNTEETLAQPEYTHLRFHGQAAEYFKIWIVNLLLTIITFGIYSPWAKIRKMKYMNQSTEFKGSRMDYHAEPLPILIGRAIALVLFALYFWGGQVNWTVGLLGYIFLILVLPFLFVKSMRFKAKVTSYRNIRFSFRGTIQDAYQIWFRYGTFFFIGTFIAIVSVAIFGEIPVRAGKDAAANLWSHPVLIIQMIIGLLNLIYMIYVAPRALSALYNYIYNNLYYGNAKICIHATPESVSEHVVGPYFRAIGLFFFSVIAFAIMMAIGVAVFKMKGIFILLVPLLFGVYAFIFYISLLLPYLTYKFVWNRLSILNYNSKINIKKSDFIWLAFTNLLGVGLSLGLLIPWAQIRFSKFLTESKAFSIVNLDQFSAETSTTTSPVADEIMDIFDVDFENGL